jgi:hypothetical protein
LGLVGLQHEGYDVLLRSMNNPFQRLKHYSRDNLDPKENHATECLAACLVFSEKMRVAFLNFLFGREVVESAGTINVVTQQPIEGGYLDLVLQDPGKLVIAVEIKVGSPEDGDQLTRYATWLKGQPELNRYLFTLVRSANRSFDPISFGAEGRETWKNWYSQLRRMLKEEELSDCEVSLARHFCEYLEKENIVNTYNVGDLGAFAAGVQARKAVAGIFSEVGDRLQQEGFETFFVEHKTNEWPRLSIKHPDWKRVFGGEENWKLTLWFCVPGIWEATEHKFYLEIDLWHEAHRNSWKETQPKIANWVKLIEEQGFQVEMFTNWTKSQRLEPSTDVSSQPKRIIAFEKNNPGVVIDRGTAIDENELVQELACGAKRYAAIVKSLGS